MSYQRPVYYDDTALMVDPYYPMTHVLNLPKNVGQSITASWSVRNVGGTVAHAQLQLQYDTQGAVAGPIVMLQPGASSAMGPISTVIASGTPGVVRSGVVNMVETSSAGAYIRTVASHGFTVLIGGGGGAALEAVGEPSIT